jgi:uncharacterized protein YidB (DUF937 family)
LRHDAAFTQPEFLMGLLDGLIGGVLGSAMGGGAQQGNNPLGSLLSSLTRGMGGAQNAGQNPGPATAQAGALGGPAAGALLAAAMALVQQQGGLSGLLEKFRQSGLGQHADSWVGTGPNMAVTGDQLHQALGGDALGGVAARLGIPVQQAGASMAQLLPELINQLTPGGQVPGNHNSLIADGLKMLQGLGH